MKPILLLLWFVCSLFALETANQWGENVTGVTTRFQTDKKEIALTFDACGGSTKSSQIDEKLLNFLIIHQIPATLFINARWIDSNLEVFKKLASNPLFEIANHGTLHKPLSIQGKGIYGISGTNTPEEVIAEIEGNNKKIEKLTGKRPYFFRSGTAYYDEKAVEIARNLGMEIGGYSVLGDAGATFSAHKVAAQLGSAKEGDIILLHMNHPESGTREGVADGILYLENQGFSFVRLSDVKKDLIRVP
jgi:peptidoglycan/xylan/chitin deacetylase (PgdA/CDA1 family)